MKEQRSFFAIICIALALISAAVAFFAFKAQIFDFVMELKEKINEKRCGCAEYTDSTCAEV